MKITISIMNLRDYTWKYYDIESKVELNVAIENFLNEKDHDFEIQLIESEYVGLNDDNINEFLELKEQFPEVNAQEILYLINVLGVDEAEQTLNEEEFYAIIHEDNKIEAFREYIIEYNMLYIPDNLESYIDWQSILRDWECGGTTVKRVDNGVYLIK